MTTSRMDMLVQARNQASGVFREVRGDLDQLNSTAKMVSGGMMGIAAAAGVDALANLGKAAFDMGRDAQGVQALKSSFDDLAGSINTTGPALLSALEGVSQGMISQQDLILSANRAVLLGVTDSQAEMEQLMQVAITRGRAMGLSATQAFNDLVTGLGRMSPLILDNLGIVTGGEKVFRDYAAGIGKTAEALTDAEKKQALFNKVLAESQDMMAQGVQGNPFAQMEAQLANFRLNAGATFAPLAGELARSVADALGTLNVALENAETAGYESLGQKWGYVLGEAMGKAAAAAFGNNNKGIVESLVQAQMDAYVELTKIAVAMGDGMQAGDLGTVDPNRQAVIELHRQQFEVVAQMQEKVRLGYIDMKTALADYTAYAQQDPPNTEMMAQLEVNIGNTARAIAPLIASLHEAGTAFSPMTAAAAASATEVERNARAAWDAVSGWKTFEGATQTAGTAQRQVQGDIAAMTAALREQGAAAAVAAGQLQGMYLSAVSALGAAQAAAGFASSQAELKGMEDMWVRQGRDPDDIPFLRQEWMNQENSRLQWQMEAPQREAERIAALNAEWAKNAENVDRTTRATRNWRDTVISALSDAEAGGKQDILPTQRLGLGGGGGGGGGTDEMAQMVDGLRSQVQGVLSGALNVDVGVNPSDFLPREDAVNEDARRLADVMVRGFESPWYEFLSQKFPGMFDGAGDIKEKAAQIMRDFQAGLRPELIDKEAVKEQVKRMILGEASMSALADEIASELAGELGVSLARAQEAVGAVMGVQSGDTSGAGFAVADGFAEATNGEQMVKGMVERMEAAYSRLYQSGVKAGQQWGTGFMSVAESGVAAPLIQLLARLVTPAVVAALDDNSSRTEAE